MFITRVLARDLAPDSSVATFSFFVPTGQNSEKSTKLYVFNVTYGKKMKNK